MNRLEPFYYCVRCGELVTSPEADVLFRTGFFKIVHPMCFCSACSLEQDKADNSVNAQSEYEMYKMILHGNSKVAERCDCP